LYSGSLNTAQLVRVFFILLTILFCTIFGRPQFQCFKIEISSEISKFNQFY
jgi:hypothetical protein